MSNNFLELKNNQQNHQIGSTKSSSSITTDRPVYLGHTSLLANGVVPTIKTEPRSCDGLVGQPYTSYYQHPHHQIDTPTSDHQQQNYYNAQDTSYHHHHVTTAAKLLASS